MPDVKSENDKTLQQVFYTEPNIKEFENRVKFELKQNPNSVKETLWAAGHDPLLGSQLADPKNFQSNNFLDKAKILINEIQNEDASFVDRLVRSCSGQCLPELFELIANNVSETSVYGEAVRDAACRPDGGNSQRAANNIFFLLQKHKISDGDLLSALNNSIETVQPLQFEILMEEITKRPQLLQNINAFNCNANNPLEFKFKVKDPWETDPEKAKKIGREVSLFEKVIEMPYVRSEQDARDDIVSHMLRSGVTPPQGIDSNYVLETAQSKRFPPRIVEQLKSILSISGSPLMKQVSSSRYY